MKLRQTSVLLPLSLLACATSPAPSTPASTEAAATGAASEAPAPRRVPAQRPGRRDLIVASEIVAYGLEGLTAREVIERLQPHFLQARFAATLGGTTGQVGRGRDIVVFINGSEAGGVDILGTISGAQIRRIERLDGVQATTQLQLRDQVGGAILITLN